MQFGDSHRKDILDGVEIIGATLGEDFGEEGLVCVDFGSRGLELPVLAFALRPGPGAFTSCEATLPTDGHVSVTFSLAISTGDASAECPLTLDLILAILQARDRHFGCSSLGW